MAGPNILKQNMYISVQCMKYQDFKSKSEGYIAYTITETGNTI